MAEAAPFTAVDVQTIDPPASPPSSPAPAPRTGPAPAPPVPPTGQRVFVADDPQPDDGSPSPALGRLAELLAHRGTEGPLVVAVLGAPGAGKSAALAHLVEQASALARPAREAAPFVGGVLAVSLDASALGDDPRAAVAERLHSALSDAAPEIAKDAADEANHSVVDPHARLQALSESLDTARRRLDAERRARDEAESRRARLVETILYESAGSRVDAYARAHRGAIEAALASFGFTRGDPLATYKGLVHTLADAGGPFARIVASARSLWAYRGQKKLLLWTVLFLLAAWGLSALARDTAWLEALRGQGETMRTLADQIAANGSWLTIGRQLCLAAAALCVLRCLWRAVRFSRPLLRGAALVDADLAVRRGELDNLVAHHAQRVEALAGETEGLSRRVIEAERRVVGARTPVPTFLTAVDAAGPDRSRQAYLQNVDGRLASGGRGPARVLFALDELDALPPAAALATLERTATALRSPRFFLAAAFDDARLVRALGPDARRALERLVQVPFRVDRDVHPRWADLVSRFLSDRAPPSPRLPGANRSVLDAPLDGAEQDLLAKLAPLAGPTPRGVKRFVNLYRLGRADAADAPAAFAFALALATGGTADEKAAFAASLRLGDGANVLHRDDVGRLRAAIDAANEAAGRPMTIDEARRAKARASRWSLDG